MTGRIDRRPSSPSEGPSRRTFLRTSVIGGLTLGPLGALVAACGGNDDDGRASVGSATDATDGPTADSGSSASTATTAPPQGTVQRGGDFRVAYTYADNIEPHLLADTAGQAVVLPTAAWLVDITPSYEVAPALATEWSSEDGRRWTFSLRDDVTFHDGTLMTAEDVATTWSRLVDPEVQSTLLGTLSFLTPENIRATDDTTVEFTLDRTVSDFPVYTHAYQSGILPASYVLGDFATKANGVGPFRLVEYRPQGDVRYEAHQDYFVPDQPYFDSLTLVGFAAEDAILAALQAGDVDASVLTEFAQLPILRQDDNITIHHLGDSRHIALTMRTDQEPWTDKRVRQAFALSIGRQAFIDGVLDGTGDIGEDHPVAPIFAEYTPLDGRRERDVDAASRLLEEAGVADGVTATLTAPAEIADLADLAVYVADQASAAGFTIEVDAIPVNQWAEQSAELNFQTYGWGHRNTPSEFLNAGYRTGAAFNVTGWSNADFDDLVDQLDSTIDPEERQAIVGEIEALMADEVPAVIAFWAGQYRATRNDIEGFEPNAALLMPVATARRTS